MCRVVAKRVMVSDKERLKTEKERAWIDNRNKRTLGVMA